MAAANYLFIRTVVTAPSQHTQILSHIRRPLVEFRIFFYFMRWIQDKKTKLKRVRNGRREKHDIESIK